MLPFQRIFAWVDTLNRHFDFENALLLGQLSHYVDLRLQFEVLPGHSNYPEDFL